MVEPLSIKVLRQIGTRQWDSWVAKGIVLNQMKQWYPEVNRITFIRE